MFLDYNSGNQQQIKQCRENISNYEECLEKCSNKIQNLKNELKLANEESNTLKNNINNTKQILLRYASEKFFEICPNDIFDIIISYITSGNHHFYNLVFSCKNLNKLINNNFYIIKLILTNNRKTGCFYFRKTIFSTLQLSFE